MVNIVEKKLFTLERVWFCPSSFACQYMSKFDITRLLHINENLNLPNSIIDTTVTLFHDLQQDEPELFSTYSKTVRYEINRAEKENMLIDVYDSNSLIQTPEIVNDFKATFMSFCDSANAQYVKETYRENLLRMYIKKNAFILTKISFEHGKVYHGYIYDGGSAVLLYSASDFRNETVDRGLAGRANKLLHWKDMIYFKNKGLKSYDWGNISSKDNPNGIDKFKISFGGELMEVYNYFIGNSFYGKGLVWIKKHLLKGR